MFGLVKELKNMGVLGLNRRNAEYTLKYNARRLHPLADDKLRTKQLAAKAGIAVPELYGVIELERQIRDLPVLLNQYPECVIKPAHGAGGDGIVIIVGRSKEMYRTIDGLLLHEGKLKYHVSNILSGMYSLGGHPDKALVEYLINFYPLFKKITYQGVPDIRVIVFLGIPVMSMVRLPTRMSNGKANLHLGAIGAGIGIANGTTLTAVWRNDIVTEHPDTGNKVTGVKIPHWEALLKLCSHCYEVTGLGYQGIDIALDRDKGPLILEINARPGLNIQIASRAGLIPRLTFVEQHHKDLKDIDERVAFAQKNFAGEMD